MHLETFLLAFVIGFVIGYMPTAVRSMRKE
jgi:hypothetical protein